MSETHRRITGVIHELWDHPWGRTLMIAVTVGAVSLALRETSGIWQPIVQSLFGIIVPLSLGFTVAYIVSPLVDRIARHMNRLVATFLVYCSFVALVALILFLVVPILVKQGSDLVTRSVDDQAYLDLNGNKKHDPEEPVLRPIVDPRGFILPGQFFQDTNKNGRFDAGEPVVSRTNPKFGEVSSLSKNLNTWMKDLPHRIRSWMNSGPADVQLERLAAYWQAVRGPLKQIDDGLAATQDKTVEAWLARFPISLTNAESLPADALGCDLQLFVTKAQSIGDQAQRDRFLSVMQSLLIEFQREHESVLLAMDELSSGKETLGSNTLKKNMSVPILPNEHQEMLVFWERIMKAQEAGRASAKEVLDRITTSSNPALGEAIESLAFGVRRAVEDGKKSLPDLATTWSKSVLQDPFGLGRFLLDVLLIPIYAFFLTLGMPQVRKSIHAMIPKYGREHTVRILLAIEKVVAAFFRGRLTVCVLCAIITYIFFLSLSVPYAVVFSLLIGFATAIPLMGLIFLVPALALTAMSGGDHVGLRLILVLVTYGLVQILESTILTPTIMGREVELHPVMLIISLMFFGSLLGVLGLILAVPIAATLRILLREFVYPRLGIE